MQEFYAENTQLPMNLKTKYTLHCTATVETQQLKELQQQMEFGKQQTQVSSGSN